MSHPSCCSSYMRCGEDRWVSQLHARNSGCFCANDSKKSTGLAMTHERLMISTNLILAMVRDEAGTPFELTETRLDAM